ncbi:MAG: hypothetical protein V1934_03795 [Methanobacteriota archaeon]
MDEPQAAPRSLRIAYVICEDVDIETGVLKKIAMQMRIWQGKGHAVKLFAVSSGEKVWDGLREFDIDITVVRDFREKMDFDLLKRKIEPWKPDILYLRFVWLHPYVAKIFATYPSVMEINSNDYVEVRPYLEKRREYGKLIFYLFTRRSLYRRLTGYIYLSEEFRVLFSRYRKPGIVISNGIALSEYQVYEPPRNQRPRIIFIGSPDQRWHGVDKIELLARKMPGWDFDIIGSEAPRGVAGVPANIKYHGRLDKEEYSRIIRGADIAVGSIAVHRNGVDEASPLKVREYLAHGIPTIIGYKDTDFPDGAPFILRLPNTESNVEDNLEAIKKFVSEWKGRRVAREDMRCIDADVKEARRLEFLQDVVLKRAK